MYSVIGGENNANKKLNSSAPLVTTDKIKTILGHIRYKVKSLA